MRNWNSLLDRRTFQDVGVFPLSPLSCLSPESSQNHVLKLVTLSSRRRSFSSSSTVQARGVSIACGVMTTRGTAPASQGRNRRCLSRGGGARRRKGRSRPCLMSLTECCGRVCWCTLSYPGSLRLFMSHQYYFLWKHTNHIFSSLYIHFLSPWQF